MHLDGSFLLTIRNKAKLMHLSSVLSHSNTLYRQGTGANSASLLVSQRHHVFEDDVLDQIRGDVATQECGHLQRQHPHSGVGHQTVGEGIDNCRAAPPGPSTPTIRHTIGSGGCDSRGWGDKRDGG